MKKIKYLFLIVLCAALAFGCSTKEEIKEDTIIIVNGTQVSADEYALYLRETVQNFEYLGGEDIWETDFDGRKAEDVAKENAFNSVVAVKLAVQNCEDVEISENDESRAQMEALAMAEKKGETQESEFYDNALAVMREKYIYNAVKENIVSGINISDAQIQAFCNENRKAYTDKLMEIDADILYFGQYEEAMAYVDGAEAEAEYMENTVLNAGELKELFFVKEDIYEGDILGPYEYDDSYVVIVIQGCEKAEESFVEETMINDYENGIKDEYFAKEANKWYSAAEIEIVEKLWSEISVQDVSW